MSKNESKTAKPGQNAAGKHPEPRSPRSIRFSDFEWQNIENMATARGMNAAELVRHAAVELTTGKSDPAPERFPPEISAQIERIYRGVYLLATLKRDEMIRDGRQEEFEKIKRDARNSQNSILKGSSSRS